MGMCLSNQIKAESPFHTGVISSKNVSGNGTELSNPSSKDSSASILPTTWSEGVISSKNVSGNWTELSNPSSKASSASVPHNSQSEGANSSKNVSGNGTELSNPSSKASSASIPQIPWSEGVISSEYVHGKGTELCSSSSKASSASVPLIPWSEGEILQSSNLKSFTFSNLEAATRNFCPDNVLGEGGFGSVFKGWVDERSLAASKPGVGMVIAVKRLNKEGWQGHKEWLAEINYLGQLHHPNLVNLIGYCLEDDQRLLVYEFMPKGSMENHLFRRGSHFQPHSWHTRMKIALGAARGLAFLHSSKAKIIYRDFNTSNILLDSNYNAKISDFGLARDGPTDDKTHVSTRVKGTYGYTALEYLMTGENKILPIPVEACNQLAKYVALMLLQFLFPGHLTAKVDVYSFGVVLLEILFGKRAIDKNRLLGEQDLVAWAKSYLTNMHILLRFLDPCLEGQYSMSQASMAATLAFQCLSAEPKSRPTMDEVVTALEQIQESK